MTKKNMTDKVNLPALVDIESEDIVKSITESLNFPRTVLATQTDIETVWGTLKNEISAIKLEYRHEMIARMVVAIRVGLFSSAVNEMWNTTVLVLRDKIRSFGLNEANQFLTIKLDEKKFKELKDKELLDISVELGLLSEDSYFFLNHCREIRNNYSSAHPASSMLDGAELNYFIHQCVKQVLSNEIKLIGFRSDEFITSISKSKLDKDALKELSDRIRRTNELQKTAILKALFGIYVDERKDEHERQNCLDLSRENWDYFSEQAKGEVVSMFSEYLIQDNTKKQYAKLYFEKVDALALLPKNEQIALVGKLVKQLESTHFDFNNFYNETAFAERLAGISKSIPFQLIKDFVYVTTLCYVGNQYGTSNSAEQYYKQTISNFTVREIDKLFELINEENYLKYRLSSFNRCRTKFKELLQLLNIESVPSKWKAVYDKIVK